MPWYKKMPLFRRRPGFRRRRPAFKRKYKGRKRVYRKRPAHSTGFMKILRKLPEIYVRNSGVAGAPQNNDPTATCMTLGTPIVDAVGGTYTVPFAMKFRLDQVINSTDITNLADNYRIKRAYIRMTYQSTQSSVNSLSIMPNIQWIQDTDDVNVPASINEVREKMGVKFMTFGFNKICKISVTPKIQDTAAGAGGVVANVAPKSWQWLNTTFANVEHVGIKGLLSNVSLPALSGGLTSFKFDVALALEAKNFQ